MRNRAQRIPSWPGETLSNKGRIHLRRPNCHLHFSLAERRRTIHLRRPNCHLHFSLAEWRRTIHLLRHNPALTRRLVVYFCAAAYNRTEMQRAMQVCGMCDTISAEDCLPAFEENVPVGLARLEFGGGIPYIKPVAVLPEGQRKGVGTRLLRIILSRFPEVRVVARGCVTEFYRNLGFQRMTWEEVHSSFRQDCEQCPDRAECNPCPMAFRAVPNELD